MTECPQIDSLIDAPKTPTSYQSNWWRKTDPGQGHQTHHDQRTSFSQSGTSKLHANSSGSPACEKMSAAWGYAKQRGSEG